MTRRFAFLLRAALSLLVPAVAVNPGHSAENPWRSVPGPVSARIVKIIDGDTLVVDAHPWPGQAVRVSVRLRGIDTPERRSRCKAERLAADRARIGLERLLLGVSNLELVNVSGGKYYGRVLADLKADTRDVASAMLDSGLARPYRGGKRLRAKCADPRP